MNAKPIIEIADVTVRAGSKALLDGFSLSIDKGERITLSGDSGSGKSTIFRALQGFIPLARGEIRIEGLSLDPRSVWGLRQRMAFVPQEPHLGDGTVEQILRRPFSLRANQANEPKPEAFRQWFETFFLPADLLDQDVGKLSGGEKQRVALISALSLRRPILLLDEVSSGLDKDCKNAVLDYLATRDDLTILAAAHDPDWAAFAGRVARLASVPNGRTQ